MASIASIQLIFGEVNNSWRIATRSHKHNCQSMTFVFPMLDIYIYCGHAPTGSAAWT